MHVFSKNRGNSLTKIFYMTGMRLACLATLLSFAGCAKDDVVQDTVLNEFEKSQAAKVASQCVGDEGSVNWKILKTDDDKKPDLKVIQATLAKKGKELEVRWLYNTSTKESELEYAGKPGGKTSNLQTGLDLGLFCM
jgi:hypothetical protein